MRYLSRFSSLLGGIAIAVLVCLTVFAVFARYVLDNPLTFTEEASGILMIWIVMIGAISCEGRDQHLSIDVLTNPLPKSFGTLLMRLVAIVSIVTLGLLAWQAWDLSMMTQFKKTQILKISWFWIDLPVVIGAVGMGLMIAIRLFTGRSPDVEDT